MADIRPFENRALELVATALSEEYGVRVISSGMRASSRRDPNGLPVITIPAVPSDNPDYRALARGYIDHEVGHVRFGEPELIEKALMANIEISGALKAVVSLFEDVMVDRRMGACFIGCRRNLRRLAILLYANDLPPAAPAGAGLTREAPWLVWNAALKFLILAVRSLDIAKLGETATKWREYLSSLAPGLADKLEDVIARLPENAGTETNIALATEIVAKIRDWMEKRWDDSTPLARKELPWLFRNGGDARELTDMGALAVASLDKLIMEMTEEIPSLEYCVRYPRGSEQWLSRLRPLDDEERKEALRVAAKMSAQMQALIQSYVLNRSGPRKRGSLDTRNLHKLFICRDDLFRKRVEKKEINTEIAICVDMSGSMRFDDKALMASKALYATAESLSHIRDLRLHILGFYDNSVIELHRSPSPLSSRMGIIPDGGTACAAAIHEAARSFSRNPRARKIIIMITDGDANDPDNFEEGIKELKKNGVDILGVGIRDDHILNYLPTDECRVIQSIDELAEALLTMIRKKMGVRA